MIKRTQAAQQLRRAIQILAAALSEAQAMEVASVFDPWTAGRAYTAGEIVTYGENKVGDPQLYKVLQDHTAQSNWAPDRSASLFGTLGLAQTGYPLWAQPTGNHDAYCAGDIVSYQGVLYQSVMDANVYSPDNYPEGWTIYEA